MKTIKENQVNCRPQKYFSGNNKRMNNFPLQYAIYTPYLTRTPYLDRTPQSPTRAREGSC